MSEETAWVIVRGPAGRLAYFTGEANEHTAWSLDHMRAHRFASQHEAKQKLGDGILYGRGAFLPDARVEEHIWTDRAAATPEEK